MATFTVNKTAATPTKTISFSSGSVAKPSQSISFSNSSSRPAVSTPTPTKTITFKTTTPAPTTTIKATAPAVTPNLAAALKNLTAKDTPTPTVTKTITFKTDTTPAPAPSAAPAISVDLAAALKNLTDKDKVTPAVTKVIEFKTTTPIPAPITTSTPPPITVDLAAALKNLTDKDKVVPEVTKVITFKTDTTPVPSIASSAFSSVAAASAITAPQLSPDINKTVQNLIKAANDAANVIANRTDLTWDSNASTADKILITNKIQDALVKAQAAANPVVTFNNFVTNQLTGLGTVAKASVNVTTSRSEMAASQNNMDAANALNMIAKLASYGMKSAASAAAAQDLKTIANESTNYVVGLASAANRTIAQDHAAIVSSIGQFVKNNIDASLVGKSALATPTKTITFKTTPKTPDLAAAVAKLTSNKVLPTVQKVITFKKTPVSSFTVKTLAIQDNASPDVIAKAVYSAMYSGKPPVSTEVWAERYGAILKVVKANLGPSGQISDKSLATIQKDLTQRLVVQASEFVKEKTPDAETPQEKVDRFNKEAAAKGLNQPKTQDKPKVTIPGSGTTDTSKVVIGETKSPDQKAAAPVTLTPVAAAAAKTATERAEAAKKSSSSKTSTTATKVPLKMSDIDPTQMYKTASGNLIPGKDIVPAELPYILGPAPTTTGPAMPPTGVPSTTPAVTPKAAEPSIIASVAKLISNAKNPFGQPVTSLQPVTKIITFTPAGMTNVKGSDGLRSVKIDTDIYNGLKQTYKDDQIADLLSDARLGVYVDTKSGNVKIGQVAEKPSETFSEASGIYRVDPYKAVTDPETGKWQGVPEFTYYKLQKLGISDADMAKIPKTVLDQMKTADTGSLKPVSGIAALPTTAQEALQLPGERQIGSGLFVEVPLTAAQRQANIDATPDPLKDPWGYLVSSAVQTGEDIYTYFAKPEYKNGYKIEPTVAGLLTFNNIATDLAKPGATLDDVKEVGGMSSYETFSATMAHASPEVLAQIAKNNPRLIVGASVDNSLQGILEAKMGEDYWGAIATGLTDNEYKEFETELRNAPIDKPMGDVIKGYVETGADLGKMPDIIPYATGQLTQLGKDIIISPVTPNVGVNLLLAPLLIIGKAPVTIAKTGMKAGEKAGVLTLVKTAQGMSALRDGKVIGSVVGDSKDASKFVVDGFDGSKIELTVKGDTVTATEVKEASVTVTRAPTEIVTGTKANIETVPFKKPAPSTPTKIIEFKKVTPAELKAQPISQLDVKIPETAKVTDLRVPNEMDEFLVTPEKLAKMSSIEPEIAYKPLTSADLNLVADLGDDMFMAENGQKYVKYGKDKYLPVGDGYDPKAKGILSVESLDDAGNANVVHLITADSTKDIFHITYEDASGLKKTISANPGTYALSDADAMKYAQNYEDELAKGAGGTPEGVAGAGPQDVEAMQAQMDNELAAINAQLDSEKAPSGGGGGGDYGGSSSGGSGGSTYYPPADTTDVSKWTYNADWDAKIMSPDGGKTWMVEDPETLVAYSTTDYEKLVLDRIEQRRAKYDATLNTYKKTGQDADGKWTVDLYQDSAGGWVTKTEFDTERAAIAANNPTFTMGVDGTARIRTNDVTHGVQYLDEMTGNWVTKDVYDALKGSSETPIWNAEGGYYYYQKADGSFEIQNPWTNARQTPDEYGAYLSEKAAAATPVAPTQVATYQAPSSYESYVPNLQSNYAATVAPIEARATTVEEAADAWTVFTQTPDFDRIIKSDADTKILIKAKDGKSLSAEEIDRALYLRSRMTPDGQNAFDAATGGQTSANLMPMNDFENLITGNRAQIGTMTDAEIKASGLPPEKEIIVHQTKAEENLGKFLMSNEYQGASPEAKKIINAELGYYAGEPSNIPNLLNQFNEVRKDWTIPTSVSWDKTVEAMRSSKNLIPDMPPWWKAENVDFSVSEMVLGNNKYADVVIGEKAKGPTKYVMETTFQKALEDGFVVGGEDGYQATRYAYKKLDGWVVRSPDGKDISFVAKNEFITTADEAISSTRAPLDMYFWEMPTNVPNEFRIPNGADGSIVEAVTKVDPFSFPEATWKGLTDAGGLSKDMTKEFVKIDLRTPDGQVWSTIREADKSKAFTVGKRVDLFEQDAIRINGLAGTDIQKLSANDYRKFISDNAAEIRNLPEEDLPYLTKYLDETRSNLMDEVRATTGEVPAGKAAEVVQPQAAKAQEVIPTGLEKSRYTQAELDELQNAWRSEMKGLNETTFKDMVARNMDDIEQLDIEKLGLNESRKAIIRGEIKDRNFMRSLESRVKDINNRVAQSRADMLAGRKTKYAHIEEVKQGIEDKNALLRSVEDIKTNFADRFGEAEKVVCGAGTGFSAGLGAGAKGLTPLLTIAAAGGAGLTAGLVGMEGMNYKNELVANFEAEQRAASGVISPAGNANAAVTAVRGPYYVNRLTSNVPQSDIMTGVMTQAEMMSKSYASASESSAFNKAAASETGTHRLGYVWQTPSGPATQSYTVKGSDLKDFNAWAESQGARLLNVETLTSDNYQTISASQAHIPEQAVFAALEGSSKTEEPPSYGSSPARSMTTNAPQTVASSGAFTSLDQIDRSAEYVTKSGNLYRGADLVETDLPYVVRKAGGQ